MPLLGDGKKQKLRSNNMPNHRENIKSNGEEKQMPEKNPRKKCRKQKATMNWEAWGPLFLCIGEGFSEHEKKMNTNITSTRTPTQTLGIKIQTLMRLYHSFIRLLMLLEMFLQARYGKKRQQTYNMLLFIHPCVWGYIFCEVFIFLLTSCLLEKKRKFTHFSAFNLFCLWHSLLVDVFAVRLRHHRWGFFSFPMFKDSKGSPDTMWWSLAKKKRSSE